MNTQTVLEPSAPLSTGITSRPEPINDLTTPLDSQFLRTSSSSDIATTSAAAGTGLKGDYFSGKNFDTLKLSRTDATVNFNWGSGAPNSAVGADNFSVRWSGQVQPKSSGNYTFYTSSDDGVRLWVNGQKLIDNWTDHATIENKGAITLTAGQKYDLKLEYYENGGQAVSKLLWSSPTEAKEVVPQSQLFNSTTPSLPPAPLPTTFGNNLLTNGSFENPTFPANETWKFFGNIPGWQVSTGEFIELQHGSAQNGAAWAELDTYRNSGIRQLVTTEAGKNYQLSFGYSPEAGSAAATTGIEVLWNGQKIDTIALDGSRNTNNVWKTFTYQVQGGSGASTALEFRATGISDGTGGYLDNVQVRQVLGGTAGADTIAPTASLGTAANITTGGGTSHTFTVNYNDNVAVNVGSLDNADIRVTGVNGFSQLATRVSVNNTSNGSPRSATYSVAAPGGSWDTVDNGTYTIALQPNQVSDTSGNVAAAATLGNFGVSIPTTPPPLDVNDKPAIIVPGGQAIASGTQLAISGIKISDPDAGNGQITVTLNATNGSLTVNGSVNGGVSVANIRNNGTGSVVLVGTLMQIGATLANPNAVLYAANSGFLGTDTVKVTVNDNGNTGAGGAQTDTKSLNVSVYAANNPGGSQALVGTNLNGIADWSTQWPFVDVFKTSRDWVSQRAGAGWGQGGQLNLTPEGWVASLAPGQSAEALMMIDTPHYPSGQYTLLYEGDGKIAFGGGATVVSQSPGRMVVNVDASKQGVFLQLKETNPSNPVRNIRFIMPGFENTYQTQPFHPTFLERLSKFGSLRFMDWMSTNNSEVVSWSDRNTPNSARQAGGNGVALEYMIQLANTLKIDPWFTIPAKASDDYVRNFAAMVRDRLDPSLQAHVEYSNEVWNTMFTQSQYATQQGQARNLAPGDDGYLNALRFYSERSTEIFNIFEQVFGASTDSRVIKVLAGQSANPWVGEQILGWKEAYKKADAYAIAPYFDGADSSNQGSDLNNASLVDRTLRMSTDQIVDSLLADIPTEVKNMVDSNYNVATKRFGLPLYAYEGGPHLTAYQFSDDKVQQVTQLFAAVNDNPRMRDVYREYLNQWKQSGGTLFNQFTDVSPNSKWGFWGSLEYQNEDPSQAPKYQGLMDFINANPGK